MLCVPFVMSELPFFAKQRQGYGFTGMENDEYITIVLLRHPASPETK